CECAPLPAPVPSTSSLAPRVYVAEPSCASVLPRPLYLKPGRTTRPSASYWLVLVPPAACWVATCPYASEVVLYTPAGPLVSASVPRAVYAYEVPSDCPVSW